MHHWILDAHKIGSTHKLLKQKKIAIYKPKKKNQFENNYSFKNYLVFPTIFGFLKQIPKINTQVLIHPCMLLLMFFSHMMHFCILICANLIGTYFKPLQFFFSMVGHWQALEKIKINGFS
jgi:hypothetical protein